MVVDTDVQFLVIGSFYGKSVESSFLEAPELIMESVVFDGEDNAVPFFYFLLVETHHHSSLQVPYRIE